MAGQLATFYLNGLHCGVDVVHVQEVIRYQDMTRVPLAPSVVEGLINLRGQIVCALDLRRRMGLPRRASGALPMNVVLRTSDGPVSLLVDEIGDVVDVEQERLEPVPETVRGLVAEVMTGVYKQDGRLLLVLAVERALQLDGVTAEKAA